MSSESVNSSVANRMLLDLEERPTHNTQSENVLENGMTSSTFPITRSTSETNETTWINSFVEFHRILSGSLLRLFYRFIDIIILFIGLSSSNEICNRSNRLVVTSICLLIFYFIDLIIIFYYFIRNQSSYYRLLTEEGKTERLRHVSTLRGCFIFFKLIPVCIGTSYSFTSKITETNNCELIRFCLGLVCISTLLLMIMPPTKPELPTRRSLPVECFILSCILIINLTYICTIASPMKNIEQSPCLILFSCTTLLHIINLLISQLCYRLTNGRQLHIYYYALQYTLTYFGALIAIYYFSVGALFLFQPRSGQPCRAHAPASITVPILELIRGWLSVSPVQIYSNPPASQDNINVLPVVLFGQEPDRFN
ncbi:unnamed protein product [Rotaria socialis]|uniref:Uncharacterized protein n=1 Tax=Rotaria socialis TaxID=392032 RepID=A0A817ZRC5_9BILA|nr:unnamed protein product [Rotaria socialis]